MKIAVGSDHAGFALKEKIKEKLFGSWNIAVIEVEENQLSYFKKMHLLITMRFNIFRKKII